jgi:hypothetical protein
MSLQAGKEKFEAAVREDLKDALKEGFKSTFMCGDSELGDDMADAFAQVAAHRLAPALTSRLYDWIRGMDITLTPTALANTGGPVTGMSSTMSGEIRIM